MELKKSKFEVEFHEDVHAYFLVEDGKKTNLEGITGLLKRQLFPDMLEGIPANVLKSAAERGTTIHKDIHLWHTGGFYPDTKEGLNAIELIAKKGMRVIASEYLVSDGKNYASAIDMVTRDADGGITLIDFKTSRTLEVEYVRWQLSLYAYFLHCQGSLLPYDEVKIAAIHLPKERDARWVDLEPIAAKHCAELLKCETEGKQYTLPECLKPAELVLAPQLIDEVHNVFLAIEGLKKRETELREELLHQMMSNGVKSFKCDRFSLTVKEASERTSLDSTSLKKKFPDIYEKFLKKSQVKESLIIKIK